MKNTLYLLLLLTSFNTYSQWGLSGSINSSSLSTKGQGSATEYANNGIGLSIGGFYDLEVNNRFTFRGRVRYAPYNTKLTNLSSKTEIDVIADYIMINPTIIFKASYNFFLVGGLQLGIAPNIEGEVDIGSGRITVDYGSLPNSKVNKIAMFILGVGYDPGKVQLNLTIESSLNPAYEENNTDYEGKFTAVNLGLDYLF